MCSMLLEFGRRIGLDSTIRFLALRMAGAVALASLGVSSTAQEKVLEAEPDVFAAFIELRDENAEYDGDYCPPTTNKNEICLGSSILIQKGTILRILSGKAFPDDSRIKLASGEDERGEFVRFRFIAGHASIRARGGRHLAVLEPTDEGYVFLQWKRSNTNGQPCFPKALMEHYGDRLNIEVGETTESGTRCVRIEA